MEIEKEFTILPPTENRIITASAGFISLHGNHNLFVAVKNKRGWDIPGGHTLDGETPLQTMERELLEETGCRLLPDSHQIAILESVANPQTGICIFQGLCTVGKFISNDEIFERTFLSFEQLEKNYFGGKDFVGQLLKLLV